MADLEKLDNIISELEEQSNNIKSFTKVYQEVEKLKNDIAENLKILQENNIDLDGISKNVKSSLENIEERAKNLETNLLSKIQELYIDNKNFQKELDSSIITRLDKHKSDIQIEIRNEGTQIQRSFETVLNKNFNSMENKLKESFSLQSKQLNLLKILVFIVIVIGVGLAVGLYFK